MRSVVYTCDQCSEQARASDLPDRQVGMPEGWMLLDLKSVHDGELHRTRAHVCSVTCLESIIDAGVGGWR